MLPYSKILITNKNNSNYRHKFVDKSNIPIDIIKFILTNGGNSINKVVFTVGRITKKEKALMSSGSCIYLDNAVYMISEDTYEIWHIDDICILVYINDIASYIFRLTDNLNGGLDQRILGSGADKEISYGKNEIANTKSNTQIDKKVYTEVEADNTDDIEDIATKKYRKQNLIKIIGGITSGAIGQAFISWPNTIDRFVSTDGKTAMLVGAAFFFIGIGITVKGLQGFKRAQNIKIDRSSKVTGIIKDKRQSGDAYYLTINNLDIEVSEYQYKNTDIGDKCMIVYADDNRVDIVKVE